MTRTILTTAAGHGIDLRNPTPADYADFAWQAEHLAKENRFNGATPGVTYSVAQHAAIGAHAVMSEVQDPLLAAYVLLHDNHEAVLRDDTTPKKRAIAAEAQDRFGVLSATILDSFDALVAKHDAAIHEAAGLVWPPHSALQRAVKHWDQRLLVTEWRDVMRGVPLPGADHYAGIEPLARRIVPVRWQQAKAIYLELAHKLLPALRGRATAQPVNTF